MIEAADIQNSVQRMIRHLRGKALIKYRHTLLATIRAAEGEMEHASMRLGWGRKWRAKAKADLLKAGRKRGVALQQHWVTIGRNSITLRRQL